MAAVHPAVRMGTARSRQRNGETCAQMAHARSLRSLPHMADTSVDQPWEIAHSTTWVEKYCVATTLAFLLPKVLAFALPLFVTALPVSLLVHAYGGCLPRPCDGVPRGCSFALLRLTLLVLGAPFLALVLAAYAFDSTAYHLFCLPAYCVRLCTCQRTSVRRSMSVIRPYRGGPSVFAHPGDLIVALLGQCERQGPAECAGKMAWCVVVVPWMKYYLCANPWLFQLDERMVQQISTSLADMPLADTTATSHRLISRARDADRKLRAVQDDLWSFCPHYPYPPPSRDWALGLQAAMGNKLESCFMVVHTTHALRQGGGELRDPDWLVLSNSVAAPVYRVMLWYNNPYHVYTGWVEASISTGGKSQPDKLHGGEHPMWLVTSHAPLNSARKAFLGPGSVDRFFDGWLPFFVDEVRRGVRGEEAMRELHEEVVSKNGASRPVSSKSKMISDTARAKIPGAEGAQSSRPTIVTADKD